MFTDSIVDLLIHEPASVYHSKAAEFLSSHRLADFRRCPNLYHRKQQGLIKDEDRPAYLIGRAGHTRILEGREAYETEFAIGGPINPRTGEPFGSTTKAFEVWAASQRKPVLTRQQGDLVDQMAAGVHAHALAKNLLSGGVAEAVVRCKWHNVDCQIRLDYLSDYPGAAIVDLKTADDLTWFEADARRYGYAHQLAFYRSIVAAAAQIAPREIPVHLIAVEKKEPFRAGVWKLGEDVLASAQKDNEEAVKRLRHCRATGIWPTGYESIRAFDWI